MVAITRTPRLSLPGPRIIAAMGGAAAALAVLATPVGVLESAVGRTGLPSLLAAAEPPLGWTARVAMMLVLGGLVAAILHALAKLTTPAPRRHVRVARNEPWEALDAAPNQRRADAHPDAPPRPPVLAMRDLGTPFLDVVAERIDDVPAASKAAPRLDPVETQPLPADLDQPLAAFDRAAIPAVPATPVPPVRPLYRPEPVAGERIEAFALTPMIDDDRGGMHARRIEPAEAEASIQGLLDRLDAGIARRASPREAPPAAIESALASLRQMAARA